MALTLPTITINDPVKEARIIAAFKPTPDSTTAEAAAAYREWLVNSLTIEVIQREITAVYQQAGIQIQQKRDEITNMMVGT